MVQSWIKPVLWLACLLSLQAVHAHETHPEHSASALTVSVTADHGGRVWLAQVKQGQVWVSVSDDAGKHFSTEVAVSPVPMTIAADAEARPNIAAGANGAVYVTWTEALKKNHAGNIWFARSLDGGKKFEAPYIVHQHREEITHRNDALQVAADGTITVVWLDKRDMLAAKAAGKSYDGAAIYYAVSRDQGKSFSLEQKLADHSCECCRIAMTSKPDGTIAVLWRHVFEGNERDHAMAEIGPVGKPVLVRASYGHWKIEGCPHHGAALAVGEGFGYHLAYFDGAGDTPGLRIARMDGQAWVTSPPRRFGDAKRNAGHPALLSVGDQVWLAWQEHDPHGADIVAMASSDGGRTWGAQVVILHSTSKLDYPQWLTLQGQATLAVNTADQGLQLLPFTN
ncbi:sialidase family protein [Methylophilus sp. QUAN]|uniref:sialidase family protein n=1 Tax=Methylophilus sp. QUAN TaxID=2781020 RepID=UPI001890947D|nr:sialidase family protein [Methylophilus sp. QUAN]MBF4990139.1 exo-alpha-sialidase [Methylophilus sp. QUAN]